MARPRDGRVAGRCRRRRRTSTTTCCKYGFRPETNRVDFVSDVNFSVGGPVIARKLRVFGSFRDWRVHVNVPAAFSTTGARPDRHHVGPGQRQLPDQRQEPADRPLLAPVLQEAESLPERVERRSVHESTSNEDDVFDIYQVLWNSVVTQKFFVDARVGLQQDLLPDLLERQRSDADSTSATSIRTRNTTAGTERMARSLPGQRHRPVLRGSSSLGGRHEFKFGFDYAHSPVENRTTRFDDVDMTYSSATGLAQNVTLFATPFYTKTAVDVTALYAQDSIAWKRLTVTAGVRWEHLNGYLPEQSSPASRFFPEPAAQLRAGGRRRQLEDGGPAPQRRLRPDRQWPHRAQGSRPAATTTSIASGGGILDGVNPNANYQEQYTWNDANGDRHFQPGEQTGTPVVTRVLPKTISVDPDYLRPYTDEYTGGVDHELFPALRLSVGRHASHRAQSAGDVEPGAIRYDTFLTTRADTGRDGVAGTADDTTFQFYNRTRRR